MPPCPSSRGAPEIPPCSLAPVLPPPSLQMQCRLPPLPRIGLGAIMHTLPPPHLLNLPQMQCRLPAMAKADLLDLLGGLPRIGLGASLPPPAAWSQV